MIRRNEELRPTFDHLGEDDIIDAAHGLARNADRDAIGRHADECASCRRRLRDALADRERAAIRGVPRVRRPRWPVVAVASAAAIVLAVLGWEAARTPPTPAAYVLPAATIELSKRSVAAEDNAERLSEGLDAYVRGDLDEAVAILGEIEVPPGADGLRGIYLASALARRGDKTGARRALEELQIAFFPREWRDRANWILYSLVRDEAPARAHELLLELRVEGGEFSERAAHELRTVR